MVRKLSLEDQEEVEDLQRMLRGGIERDLANRKNRREIGEKMLTMGTRSNITIRKKQQKSLRKAAKEFAKRKRSKNSRLKKIKREHTGVPKRLKKSTRRPYNQPVRSHMRRKPL
jgi:hypothetical protein